MKNVVIVGGSSGIGKETARVFLEQGERVFIIGKTPHKVQATLKDLNKIGEISGFVTDIKDENSVSESCKRILEWGVPDFILLSAGEGVFTPLPEVTIEDYRKVIDSEVLGKLMFLREILPRLNSENVDIVILGSTLSYEGIPDASVYVAAKHAVKGMIRALREEYFYTNWRFILVSPDDVNTNFLPEKPPHPQKIIEPEDLAVFIYSLSKLPPSLTPTEIIIKGRRHENHYN